MKYYLAPLEGITNLYYRQCFAKHFKNVDKIYIPFLSPINGKLSTKDLKEVAKENNDLSIKVVPQIISKSAKDTIELINYLKSLGYDEINLNFGCPSPTVVTKGKGSGMLKDITYLDNYLKEVFTNTDVKISIKSRLGIESENEFKAILDIYNKYPISELIIHLRVAKDLYSKPIRLECLNYILENSSIDVIYNGEIKSKEDINVITSKYPNVKGVMIGRGLIANPTLLEESFDKEKIISFYYELKNIYLEKYGWNNLNYYIKEIWALLINSFEVDSKIKKALFKVKSLEQLNKIEEIIFNQ